MQLCEEKYGEVENQSHDNVELTFEGKRRSDVVEVSAAGGTDSVIEIDEWKYILRGLQSIFKMLSRHVGPEREGRGCLCTLVR